MRPHSASSLLCYVQITAVYLRDFLARQTRQHHAEFSPLASFQPPKGKPKLAATHASTAFTSANRECVEHQPSPQEYSMSGACTAPSLGAVPERELRVVTGGVVPGACASRAPGTAATVGSIW